MGAPRDRRARAAGRTDLGHGYPLPREHPLQAQKKLAGDTVWIDREAITVTGEGAVSRYPLADITAVTAVGKKKFNFYYRGQTLQIKGDKRFCSIKYVHVFDGVRAAGHAEQPAEARIEHAERPDTSAEEPV